MTAVVTLARWERIQTERGTDLDWRQLARCAGRDVKADQWHTDRSGVKGQAAWARHVCLHHCPVLRQCHADAEAAMHYQRQSCVLGGVIYNAAGNPTRRQRAEKRCQLCPKSPVDERVEALMEEA